MIDPISDLITRIRNAYAAGRQSVEMPYSKFKMAVLNVMKVNGYIGEIEIKTDKDGKKTLVIALQDGAIKHIKRLSKPGQRIYVGKSDIPRPLRGLGLIIISTPSGVISGNEALKKKLGGELICEVW